MSKFKYWISFDITFLVRGDKIGGNGGNYLGDSFTGNEDGGGGGFSGNGGSIAAIGSTGGGGGAVLVTDFKYPLVTIAIIEVLHIIWGKTYGGTRSFITRNRTYFHARVGMDGDTSPNQC